MKVPFKCPSCGSDEPFVTASEPKSYDDLLGASCSACGHKLTDEDIKEHARTLAMKLLEQNLKNIGR
jgi:predicted RNA-binding Zn-ribbon protein involved in translation (DUF1610 family)